MQLRAKDISLATNRHQQRDRNYWLFHQRLTHQDDAASNVVSTEDVIPNRLTPFPLSFWRYHFETYCQRP
jgi:hypothetical protein